eukprot:TRINITY_DN7918_c0_g1_i1.p2 TRINITY_DN7918_c0_g1~~TRINITY_DN7918_c0_g1_i1.p2  ORF type:complete len:106 (+),score=1.90 TRINITY_DN7918_c0_g1_i1:1165-1482(+)
MIDIEVVLKKPLTMVGQICGSKFRVIRVARDACGLFYFWHLYRLCVQDHCEFPSVSTPVNSRRGVCGFRSWRWSPEAGFPFHLKPDCDRVISGTVYNPVFKLQAT